jgi:PAS domain S-box-containing protein
MKRISLKTRMTLFLPVATCVLMGLLLYVIQDYLERSIRESVSSQQYLTVSFAAHQLDQKLNSTQKLLTSLSREITPELIDKPVKALHFLQQEKEFTDIFDNGMFLFNGRGLMVAELPLGVTRSGTDFSYRQYIKATFASRAPQISDPYISSQGHHHPAIMFTSPIFDAQGEIIAILGGSIDLMQTSTLGMIDTFRIGKTGYMFLISEDRKIILHPDKKRILSQEIGKGSNLLVDRAIEGFSGTDETVNSSGIRMLTSLRHLTAKNWILGANYPINEAYASLFRLKKIFIASIIPILLLSFLVMRHFLKRITDPLTAFTLHVEQLPGRSGSERLYTKKEIGEIATLGNAFNNLITELDQQRNELTRRELLYRTVVEFSTDLVFWISPDRETFYYISPSCDRITGYHEEEFYRDTDLLNRIIHPDHRIRWQEHLAIAGTCDCTEPIEFALNTRQGVTVWVSHVCLPVHGEGNEYRGVRGSFRDITIIKESEQARLESDARLHRQNEYLMALHETTLGMMSRLEINDLLFAIINRAARLMDTSHGYIYLLNAEETEMVIQVQVGIFDTFEHHSLKRGEGMAGHVWESGVPCQVDDYRTWSGRLPDPARNSLHALTGVPLTSGGEVVGVIGLAYIEEGKRFDDDKMELLSRFAELASLALDNARLYDAARRELGERIKAEESLRKLSYAVEQSPVSIVITDTDGIIEYANPHFSRLTGYTPEELLGQNPSILKSGFTSQAEYRQLWETILAGGEWRGEFHNRRKDGDYYWELAHISPLRDKNGAITHFIAVKEDINDRKKLENQLRHSQKMEAVGQLAGGIAHDFNNILTAIIGYATILQMKTGEDTPLYTTVSQILATAERGASLTQGLLAFSRKQVSNPSRINLNEIVNRVEKLLLRLIGEDIRLTSLLSAQPLPVMADSMQIEQVLMNLATNARDAMAGGGSIIIRTELAALDSRFVAAQGFGDKGRYALLTVSDTGSGMDEETCKRIFEPFYTTKETGKGTGLGLSIIYGIVKKHGGFILCNSTPGTGSEFCIYLPMTEDPELQVEGQAVVAPFCGGSEVILLAEDDEMTRLISKELLEEFGYTVIEAENGLQALERYRENMDSICLVILDAIMPGMKGIDVFREIRALNPDERVLFCSGYNADDIEKQGALDRNFHFIAKPFMPKELLMKIREVLEDEA